MKEEKGITLIALIIYIILMTFAVAGVAAVTNSLYSNINNMDKDAEGAVDFAKFNMYFLNDIKNNYVEVSNYSDNQIVLLFENDSDTPKSISYSVQEEGLYRNSVKICDDVQEVKIQEGANENEIIVYLKIKNYEKTTTYVLEEQEPEDEDVIV